MKKHVLKLEVDTPIKEMGMFIYDNNVIEGDQVELSINGYDFIQRKALFQILRGTISANRKVNFLKPLGVSKYDLENFFEDQTMVDALTEETGVQFILN